MSKSVNIITLGCSKNLVDSEHLARQFAEVGYKVVFDSDDFADTLIINTCGFIHDAKEESVDAILRAIQAKEAGKVNDVHVIGCLSERYADDLRKEIPEVDSYFGNKGYIDVLKQLQIKAKDSILNERIVSTPKHFAYLKIAEGCDRSCSYCAIPAIRGAHVSEPIESLVKESQFLVSKGVRELALISQDLSYYGIDIYKKNNLAQLVSELEKIDQLEWIRLHYLYPNNFPMDVLELMNESSKVCHYIDMPLQHISDKVLEKMRRGFSAQKTYQLLETIKTAVPDIALRSTLIVGHPGETEKDFQQLLDFVSQTRFDRLGVFTYSHEDGTYAAQHYKDTIPQKVKQQRADAIMAVQQDISLSLNKEKIGKTLKTIIDRKEGDVFIGRTQYDSYEVDNEVVIETVDLQIGGFYNVTIADAEEFDLYGFVD